MKEIVCRETNFSASQIRKVKPYIIDYGFEGGLIYYNVANFYINKVKQLLGTSIIDIIEPRE